VSRDTYYELEQLLGEEAQAVMTLVNIFGVTQNGDIGGAGISRFAVLGDGSAPLTNTQLNAVAAALNTMYSAWKLLSPSSVTFAVFPTVQVITVETGALTAELNIPTPGTVQAGSVGNYAAGTGARIYWHTVTIKNRRLIRGATYVTPLVASAFGTNGAVLGTTANTITTAATAYIAAILAAGVFPSVYSRPPKTLPGSGLLGAISSASVSLKPASVRSRRS
jgi:hypothetical protein